MKSFNKVLCLVALCAISSVSAKVTVPAGRTPAYSGGTEYTGGGETVKKSAYEPLNKIAQIWRTKRAITNVSNRVVFNQEALVSIQKYIKEEKLSDNVFGFLLQLIRDTQFNFTGNDAKDLVILKDSNAQIDYLISKLGSIDYDNYTKYLNSNRQAYENRLNAA